MDFENPLSRSTRAKDRGKLLDQLTDVKYYFVCFVFCFLICHYDRVVCENCYKSKILWTTLVIDITFPSFREEFPVQYN